MAKEFAWDTEATLTVVDVSEKEKHEIKLCTLNGKTFIVDSKFVLKKAGGANTEWTPVKNSTMELSIFTSAYEALQKHNQED